MGSEEVRSVSRTGGEKGVKAQRYDLLPKEALDAIAEVYAFGATKYADHNWRKGYDWGKSYAALQRHVTAFWAGETNDPESGLPHMAHAGFHVFTLLTWLAEQGEGGEFDDRYVVAPTLSEALDLADEVAESDPHSWPERFTPEVRAGLEDSGWFKIEQDDPYSFRIMSPAATFEAYGDRWATPEQAAKMRQTAEAAGVRRWFTIDSTGEVTQRS